MEERVIHPVQTENQFPSVVLVATIDPPKKNKPSSNQVILDIFKKSSLLGLRSLFVATHYVGNGLIMSSLGKDAAAGSSIASSMQSFTIGLSSGFLVNSGHELGTELGKLRFDPKKWYSVEELAGVSRAIRVALNITFILGGLSAATLVSTKYTLPLVLEKATAKAASDYLSTFAIATIPDLLIWTQGQFIFQIEKDSLTPLLITAGYRTSSVALSYLLCHYLGLGPKGIGFGAGIAGWISVLLLQFRFSKKIYRDISIYNPFIQAYFKQLHEFSKTGWKHSLQRVTEWGNLWIIAQLIGAWSSRGLLAIQPSVLTLTLCNILSQGFAQASLMMASNDCAAMKKSLQLYYETVDAEFLQSAEDYKNKIYKNFYTSTLASIAFNTILSSALYVNRERIVDLYVPKGSPPEVNSLAVLLLWINIISLIPDAIRMVSGGVLRGWGDLLVPTLMSLLLMSAIGIPIGYGIGYEMGESIVPLFIARLAALILAATFNCYRYSSHTKDNENDYHLAQLFGELHNELSQYDNKNEASSLNDDFIQHVENHGLNIVESTEKTCRLFDIFAFKINNGLSSEAIRRRLAKYLQSNIAQYENKDNRIESDVFNFIDSCDDNANNVILLALSREFKCNIVVIKSDSTDPFIVRQSDSMDLIILGCDGNNRFVLLQGEPNEDLEQKINIAPIDSFQPSTMKQVLTSNIYKQFKTSIKNSHPLQKSVTSTTSINDLSAQQNSRWPKWLRLPFMKAPENDETQPLTLVRNKRYSSNVSHGSTEKRS